MKPALAWLVPGLILIGSAALEVFGDASVRRGLVDRRPAWAVAGCLMLASYGLLVNVLRWDFSRLMGTYVAVFAVVSVVVGRYGFGESTPVSTWVGLAIIVAGGLVIQVGSK